MAEEVLELCLHGQNVQKLPVTSLIKQLKVKSNQKIVKINICLEVRDGKLFSEDAIEFRE